MSPTAAAPTKKAGLRGQRTRLKAIRHRTLRNHPETLTRQERAEAANQMVAAESRFEIPEQEEVTLVSQRKYNLDEDRPWWEKAYFRLIYLPVVRFGFKRMHIACPAAMKPDGTIELVEQQGVYTDPERAKAALKNEYYGTKQLPLDTPLPEKSSQYKGHKYPLSIMPDRYRRRTYPLVAQSQRQLNDIQKGVTEAIEQVDRIWANVRAPVR